MALTANTVTTGWYPSTYPDLGTISTTASTLTNSMWVSLNTTYTASTGSITYPDPWEWAAVPVGFTNSWTQYNTTWEETEERRLKRLQQEILEAALRHARQQGRNPALPLNGLQLAAELGQIEFTAEEIRLIEDAFQRSREEWLEIQRQAVADAHEQAVAARRAELLLESLLSAEQKREWLADKRVTEVAPSGRVWRLFPVWSGSAVIMEGEVRRVTLCVHPRVRVPEADVIVSQLLAIRAGREDVLIRTGVVHGGAFNAEEQAIRATLMAA